MAFNIRSRAGWFRLWVVASVLWVGLATYIAIDNAPKKEHIERFYEETMDELSPEAVARQNQNAQALGYPLLTPADVLNKKAAAQERFNSQWKRFESARLEYWAFMTAFAFLTPILLYGVCWLVVLTFGWIVRGFRTEP